jgi:hypothetical protein
MTCKDLLFIDVRLTVLAQAVKKTSEAQLQKICTPLELFTLRCDLCLWPSEQSIRDEQIFIRRVLRFVPNLKSLVIHLHCPTVPPWYFREVEFASSAFTRLKICDLKNVELPAAGFQDMIRNNAPALNFVFLNSVKLVGEEWGSIFKLFGECRMARCCFFLSYLLQGEEGYWMFGEGEKLTSWAEDRSIIVGNLAVSDPNCLRTRMYRWFRGEETQFPLDNMGEHNESQSYDETMSYQRWIG